VSSGRARLEQGFSLIEVLATIAIIGIVSGMSYFAFANVLPGIRSDSALQVLVAQIRQARQFSVDQRRNVNVTFQGTREIVTNRVNLDASLTLLSDYFLPYGMVYKVFTGVPDTPDGWDPLLTLVKFNACATLPCTITFQSDGSVLDAASNFVNGTVLIGSAGKANTARAVTILGATGRIKGYRWSGTQWF
jgi:prepilin-type N-terminal cleavage/methylation domain-containing protein